MEEPLYRLEVKTSCNVSEEFLLGNLQSSKGSGCPSLQFQEVNSKTLVVCASGPSAREYLRRIDAEGLQYDLMAMNGSYNALLAMGKVPDYYAQLDARAENVNFVTQPDKRTKFFLASQVHPDIFKALQGFDVTVFHLNMPSCRKVFPEGDHIFLGSSGGTIGTTALALAGVLGYRKLLLLGYDSSYAGGKSHMVDQPQNANQQTLDVELEGRWYRTTPTLADQVSHFFEWSNALHQAFPNLILDVMGEGLFYDYIVTNQRCSPQDQSSAQVA